MVKQFNTLKVTLKIGNYSFGVNAINFAYLIRKKLDSFNACLNCKHLLCAIFVYFAFISCVAPDQWVSFVLSIWRDADFRFSILFKRRYGRYLDTRFFFALIELHYSVSSGKQQTNTITNLNIASHLSWNDGKDNYLHITFYCEPLKAR